MDDIEILYWLIQGGELWKRNKIRTKIAALKEATRLVAITKILPTKKAIGLRLAGRINRQKYNILI